MAKVKIALALLTFGTLLAGTIYFATRRAPPPDEIAPAHDLQRKYGLYAENRPTIRLGSKRFPPHLRHLAPFAERWGIGDDIIRNDYIKRASPAERRELYEVLYDPFEQITAWLNSFKGKPMSDEAAAFMYMQLGLDEMGYHVLDDKARGRRQPGV